MKADLSDVLTTWRVTCPICFWAWTFDAPTGTDECVGPAMKSKLVEHVRLHVDEQGKSA